MIQCFSAGHLPDTSRAMASALKTVASRVKTELDQEALLSFLVVAVSRSGMFSNFRRCKRGRFLCIYQHLQLCKVVLDVAVIMLVHNLILVTYLCTRQQSCLLRDGNIMIMPGHIDCSNLGAICSTSMSPADSVEALTLHVMGCCVSELWDKAVQLAPHKTSFA